MGHNILHLPQQNRKTNTSDKLHVGSQHLITGDRLTSVVRPEHAWISHLYRLNPNEDFLSHNLKHIIFRLQKLFSRNISSGPPSKPLQQVTEGYSDSGMFCMCQYTGFATCCSCTQKALRCVPGCFTCYESDVYL